VIEFLSARPAHRAPVFASAVDSGTGATLIARRLQMILTARPRHRISRLGGRMVRTAAALFLCLGLVYCTPDEATAPSESAELELALPTKPESSTVTELQHATGLHGWSLANRLGVARRLREAVVDERARTPRVAKGHEVVEYVEVALHPARDGRVPLRKDKGAAEHRATLVEQAPDAAPAPRRVPFKVAERVVTSELIKPPAH
jgi:hypothetical protein